MWLHLGRRQDVLWFFCSCAAIRAQVYSIWLSDPRNPTAWGVALIFRAWCNGLRVWVHSVSLPVSLPPQNSGFQLTGKTQGSRVHAVINLLFKQIWSLFKNFAPKAQEEREDKHFFFFLKNIALPPLIQISVWFGRQCRVTCSSVLNCT